ncbi:MAG: glycosyltransferase [Candidatus Altimarinota bacterium]
MQKNKFLFLIRAYNERTRIKEVIESIFNDGFHHILVVDDGSTDGTSQLLNEVFQDQIYLVKHPINRGGGAAMETGFAWVRENAKKFEIEYVVTFDADGQHDIADMKTFIHHLDKHSHAEVIYGSRFIIKTNSNVPWYRKMTLYGGRIFTKLLSGVKLTDAHNGYRLFHISVIDKVRLTMDGMEYASELIEELVKQGYNIHEVPVNIHYDSYTLGKGQRYGGILRIATRMIFKKFF